MVEALVVVQQLQVLMLTRDDILQLPMQTHFYMTFLLQQAGP